jgi:hypothetical protein
VAGAARAMSAASVASQARRDQGFRNCDPFFGTFYSAVLSIFRLSRKHCRPRPFGA